jgi:hypothetical protein
MISGWERKVIYAIMMGICMEVDEDEGWKEAELRFSPVFYFPGAISTPLYFI